jgi:hypothetical protein
MAAKSGTAVFGERFKPPTFDAVMGWARPQNPCSVTSTEDVCHGLAPSQLWIDFKRGDTIAARQLAVWAETLSFVKQQGGVARRPGQVLRLAQIDDIERVWLKSLESLPAENRALFLMQLSADMSQSPDDDYGTGKRIVEFSKDFYIVFDGYDPDKRTFRHDSYKAGTFSIYGVRLRKRLDGGYERRLQQIGKRKGKFRICAAQHDPSIRLNGAQFLSCDAVIRLSQLLLRNPPLVAALGERSLYDAVIANDSDREGARNPNLRRPVIERAVDQFIALNRLDVGIRPPMVTLLSQWNENPAWGPCGMGCCTADDK